MQNYSGLKTPFFTILFIFLGLFLYTRFAGSIPFSVNSVQSTKNTVFNVSATGEESAIPDTASLSVGVTKTSSSVLTAQKQVNEISDKLVTNLKKLGIEEKKIKTTNYGVYPEYDYSFGKQTIKGYTVTQNLQIEIKPIDKANQAIDIATAAGANIVGGINFTLDEKTREELEQKARVEAIQKAKEKAQKLASTAGIRLGRIVDVQESNYFPPPIMYNQGLATADGRGGGGETTKVTPGESAVTVTVDLSYETY